MTRSAISLRKIGKSVPTGFLGRKRRKVLSGLDLEVERGEVFGYIGPNGAGKTTTIGIVLGLIRQDTGTVAVLGCPAGDHEARAKIGALPEQPYFYPHLTARELFDYYARLFGLDKEERREKTRTLLPMLGLGKHMDVRISKYSRGMLQRFAIAQSLVNDPDLLIYDEPFSGLDPIGRKDMMNIMLELKSKGKTIFFSTHILSDVQYLADKVGLLTGGKLTRIIDGEEFRRNSTEEMEVVLAGVRSEDSEALKEYTDEAVSSDGKIHLVIRGNENLNRVIGLALRNGYRVEKMVPKLKFLEDVFSSEMEVAQR